MMAATVTVNMEIRTVELSTYQRAILDWIANDNGNAIVKATAGSGKTFILSQASNILPTSSTAIYLAFGRANADEAKGKFAIPASTFHSLCWRAVGKFLYQYLRGYARVLKPNTDVIIDEMYGKSIDDIRAAVVRLVSLAKGENLAPNVSNDVLIGLMDRFDVDWDNPDFTVTDVCDITRAIMTEACDPRSIARRKTIDFDDQLWLVERFNLKLDKVDWLLVDEAQDTNPIQRAILRRVSHANTRLIAVGDDCQAIYGFRGATSNALNLIASEFQATVLPLSISYRCPRAVVELASRYGIIEVSPTAIDGAVTTPERPTYHQIGAMDLVLCRNTAPLVQLAYRLIARRIPVQIRGRDIGIGLKSLITKLVGKRGTIDTLPERLDTYTQREITAALSKRNEQKAQSIQDRAESILALIDSLSDDERTVPGLLAAIDKLFGIGEKADAGIGSRLCLSTIHKAKGLEANSVGILEWDLLPSKYAKTEETRSQERNLQFVAITRSKCNLAFLTLDAIVD